MRNIHKPIPPKVSIIIPIYNVEEYIEKCAISLFQQTLDNLEYIFIDDCTPDNSIEVINKVLLNYPHRKHQVKFIHHTKNCGVSTSRQDGIDYATGEYIIQCDPDDWVNTDMYEALYNKAIDTKADMVICDYYNVTQNLIVKITQEPEELNSQSLLNSITGSSKKHLQGAAWNKLIRSTYYKKAKYLDNINFCENIFILFQILQNENLKIEYLNESLYYYVNDRPGSLVKSINEKAIQGDLKLIKAIISNEFISDKFIINKLSFITILIMRSLKKDFTNKEYQAIYGNFRNAIKYNVQVPKVNKIILRIAMNGHFKIARLLHKSLGKIHRRLNS
ncbi:MAG: glycosyltransferase [Muribaculaceae bacterium]|nr:glycosyltransferase [Muribaculaceae bacterium]